MHYHHSTIDILYQKWVDKEASEQEVDELFELLSQMDKDEIERKLGSLMKSRWELGKINHTYDKGNQRETIQKILQAYPSFEDDVAPSERRIHFVRKAWFRYAAAVILVAGIGGYLWKQPAEQIKNISSKTETKIEAPVVPGGNKATLTLADGSTIVLDSAANGQILERDGARVVKAANGQIVYSSDKSSLPEDIKYNTMSTPRGGSYTLTLADGSVVWLNAASSITFPTAFTGNQREVSITGEAYFEVAKNKQKPFHVLVNNAVSINVLGTHFNINAYTDEAKISTTLVEGSIALDNNNYTQILRPGEQAQIEGKGKTVMRKGVDMQAVLAWKNDEFYFGEKTDLRSIMRQISRWYDIDVDYKGTFEGHLGGWISRKADIIRVLQMLEKAGGVKFKIEGKKVIVMP